MPLTLRVLLEWDRANVAEGPVFPITFPGRITEALPLRLRSSAWDIQSLQILTNVRLYLTGAGVPIVQELWPTYGDAYTPARPELNGGFELSFDSGRTWTRFSKTVGHQDDPATWVVVPACAIGLDGQDGVLGPFDQARLLARYVIPPQADQFQVFDIRLAVDVDII